MYGLGLSYMPASAWRQTKTETNGTRRRADKPDKDNGGSNQQLDKQSRAVDKEPPTDLDGSADERDGNSRRDDPLQINFTLEDVTRMAEEIYDETIADVHLSLFGYWIQDSDEHYDIAKQYIRELCLDQVSISILLE